MHNHKTKNRDLEMQMKTLNVDWGEDGRSNGKKLKGFDLKMLAKRGLILLRTGKRIQNKRKGPNLNKP